MREGQGTQDSPWDLWSRREVLSLLAPYFAYARLGGPLAHRPAINQNSAKSPAPLGRPAGTITLFLSGDVMTGRGIDQILPHPSRPAIYEPAMRSALGYVELAESVHGKVPRSAGFSYIWGDALEELKARSPDRRIVNLETSLTTSEAAAPKGINYRMHPRNVGCLLAARIDCCVLSNNHVLDWGVPGLLETLKTLKDAGIATAGAGHDAAEAGQPAVLGVRGNRRVLVFGFGHDSSGVPSAWSATKTRPGVNRLPDLSPRTAEEVTRGISAVKRPGDIAVVSIHWGSNWGYEIPREQRDFAHRLVDSGTVDIVHGHSSHHPRGIEVYRRRPILYGCGDFVNDYEGISGQEEFRSDLVLGYFLTFGSASLSKLEMVPFRTLRFRLQRTNSEETEWLHRRLDREDRRLGTSVFLGKDGALELRW